ncbi:MAG TPA: ligand-binding protein SH3 [Candidatus Nealsonbacteria bacterium]|nr:ligand-binding protein SH3 [Candidatus Nealsonbacteria bacterium]HEB46340.1 ligand-binding protein SH3 [Candidatus Nealsonbacteria bacterium]
MIPELKTFLIAMSPVVELRGSIPMALEVYKMPVWSAYLFSVLGNLVPLILIISIFSPVSRFLSKKFGFFDQFFTWIFIHTRKIHQSKFEKWGKNLTVIILVAIPIPFIGGWTGAIAAFVFGISFKKALPLIIIGSSLAGIIVIILTLGISKLI